MMENPQNGPQLVITSGSSPLWSVGDDGTILRHEDGAWSSQTSPTARHLRGIWGSGWAWAVGRTSASLQYGGSSWSVVTVPASGDLLGVWGSAASDVWAVGQTTGTEPAIIHHDGSAWTDAVFLKQGLGNLECTLVGVV